MSISLRNSRGLLLLIVSYFFYFNSTILYSASIPSDDKVLIETGKPKYKELPDSFRLLIWNIHKAESGQNWQKDFQKLTEQSDIVLLQEGYLNETYKAAINYFPNILWSFAISFIYEGFETGVVTGSLAQPIMTKWLRSQGREPFYESPKMTILTQYTLPYSDKNLLVANFHGINFVSNDSFYQQMDQVIQALEKHQGPTIFAGDFNTWNGYRMEYLESHCKKMGLKPVEFKQDPRFVRLDHIFYRDLVAYDPQVLNQIYSSDHFPIKVNFKIQ